VVKNIGGTLQSFAPIIDKKCKILILGTMPGPESLRRKEYYANWTVDTVVYIML